jgi:hypothetical protein
LGYILARLDLPAPFARLPALVKLNSFHGPPTVIGTAGAILAIPFSCAKAGTDKKPTDAKAIGAVNFMINSL